MTTKKQVLHSNGVLEPFKPSVITKQLLKETDISTDDADRIKRSVTSKIKNMDIDEISTSTIRAEVNAQLTSRGFLKAEEQSRKLGMSVKEFENLLTNGCRDNANIGYSPEMVAKYAYDSIAKEYALLTMPEHCAKNHIDGFIHHHDLEYFNTRPNCMNYDIRFFAKNGLKVDGIGLMGSVAKPAKSLEVLLNHLLQAWMAGATVFSGGQGYANFNTMLAPFARGRTYEDIKQAIQGFVYNCNMSLICRGGQVLFTSIGVDLSIPKVLADKPAIGPQGIPNGVYGDYQDEADLIFKAICEVSEEKDGNGAWHRFPNILFNIREGDLDEYTGNCKILHEMGANNPTIYYSNCVDMERSTMGCRSSLPMNYAFDYEKDCLNTGNFMYSTLNLPLIALAARDNVADFITSDAYDSMLINEFYALLHKMCDVIYDTLIFRRKCVEDVLYNKKMSTFLLQKDKETGEPLYDLNRTTMTIGYCGLYECLDVLKTESGENIIRCINNIKDDFHKRDGLRWSVIASPAESTAHRFAEIIKTKYPDAKVQGTKGHYYLTNSSHIPVSSEENIIKHIENANKYHPMSLGGNILHLWLKEVWSDPKSYWKLNKKILEGGTIFWAYSKVFTYCNECGFTLNDKIEECPICQSKDLITYDRCTGYYLPTKGFNNGKQQEFRDRFRHNIG